MTEKFFDKLKGKFVDPYDEDDETEEIEKVENVSEYEEASNQDLKRMNAKMIINEPRSYEDAKQIANNLLEKKACVVNIHRLQESNATRLLDFLSGVTYAIGGSKQRIDNNVFLFSPKELPVDGAIDAN